MKVSSSPPAMRCTANVVENVSPRDVNVKKPTDVVIVDVISRESVRMQAIMGPGNDHFTALLTRH